MNRTGTLSTASATVTSRDAQYGRPEDSFKNIAQFWSTYLDRDITESDVANMMILLKVAREMNKHKDDNMVDIAGYAACLNELYHSPSHEVEVPATDLDYLTKR